MHTFNMCGEQTWWVSNEKKLFPSCEDAFVGVATQNPKYPLDIQGNARFSQHSFFQRSVNIGSTENPQAALHIRGNSGASSDFDKLMIVESGGNKVLQLDENGLFRSRRIIVDQDRWADYVFKENFELMPLVDLKSYITTNKHLPDVPSEEDVKENGVDLAEMNKILLQKIEELTLYTIQQQEEIEELKKSVSTLK